MKILVYPGGSMKLKKRVYNSITIDVYKLDGKFP